MSFEFKKWYVWLAIATVFIGAIMSDLVSQFGILQPAYTLDTFDLEIIFLLMMVPFIIGMGMGIYYEKGE